MEFQKFWKERERLCKKRDNCVDCPMDNGAGAAYESCAEFIECNPEKAEQIIQKWSDEHPIKTNGEKLKEIFIQTFGSDQDIKFFTDNTTYPREWYLSEYIEKEK